MQQLWNSYCWLPSVSLIAESGLMIWLCWYLVCLFCLTEECRVSFSVLAEDRWSAFCLRADGCRTLFCDGFSGSFCRGLNMFSSFIDYVPQLLPVLQRCEGVRATVALQHSVLLLCFCISMEGSLLFLFLLLPRPTSVLMHREWNTKRSLSYSSDKPAAHVWVLISALPRSGECAITISSVNFLHFHFPFPSTARDAVNLKSMGVM